MRSNGENHRHTPHSALPCKTKTDPQDDSLLPAEMPAHAVAERMLDVAIVVCLKAAQQGVAVHQTWSEPMAFRSCLDMCAGTGSK